MNVFSTIGLNKRTAPRIVGRLPCVGEMVLVFDPTRIQSNPWAETKIYMVKGYKVSPNIFLMPVGGPDNGEEGKMHYLIFLVIPAIVSICPAPPHVDVAAESA